MPRMEKFTKSRQYLIIQLTWLINSVGKLTRLDETIFTIWYKIRRIKEFYYFQILTHSSEMNN